MDNTGVWKGELQEGAMLQYWEGNDATAIVKESTTLSGHSIIFCRCWCFSVSDTNNALRRAMYLSTSISTKPPYLGGFCGFLPLLGVLALATPTTH